MLVAKTSEATIAWLRLSSKYATTASLLSDTFGASPAMTKPVAARTAKTAPDARAHRSQFIVHISSLLRRWYEDRARGVHAVGADPLFRRYPGEIGRASCRERV